MDNNSLISQRMVFNTASRLLQAGNNSALAVLAQRVPVYTVDSKFMREHFDNNTKEDDEINETRRFLNKILRHLKPLAKFKFEESQDTLDRIERNLEELKRLLDHYELPSLQNRKLLHILSELRELIGCYQHWLRTQGSPNPNLAATAEKIARDIEEVLDAMPNPNTEYLGVYCPDWCNVNGHEKAIFICTERIIKAEEDCINLLTKVTIHEFCHAYMDIEHGRSHHADPENITYWMEESMANVMTLQIIENFALKHPEALGLLEYARQFMLKQPAAYASAVKMFDNGICDYDLWAWNKDECRASAAIKTWCSEMSNRGNSLDANTIRDLWNDVKKDIINRLSVDSQRKPYIGCRLTTATKKQYLRVTFPDGTVISNTGDNDILKEFIIKVGPDKVADNPKIMQGSKYLVSKTEANTVGRTHKSFKDGTGNEYWVNAHLIIIHKQLHIKRIIDALGLTGVVVEWNV